MSKADANPTSAFIRNAGESSSRMAMFTGSILLVLPLWAAATAAAHWTEPWSHYAEFPIESPGVGRFEIPASIVDALQPDLSDLRVAGPDGREVSYVIAHPAPRPRFQKPVEWMESETGPDRIIYILETGAEESIEFLILQAQGPTPALPASIEVPGQNGEWTEITRAVTHPLGERAMSDSVPIPPGTHSRLRVTLRTPTPDALPGFQFALVVRAHDPHPPRKMAFDVTRRWEEPGRTLWEGRLPFGNHRIEGLVAETPSPAVSRNLRLAVRAFHEGRVVERTLISGTLTKLPETTVSSAARATWTPTPVPGREIRLELTNGDSPPIEVSEWTAKVRPVILVVATEQAGVHRLLAGNPAARHQSHDLARLAGDWTRFPQLEPHFDELRPNPEHRPTETLPEVPLTAALFEPDGWLFSRSVGILNTGIQRLELPPEVLARSRTDLGDIRLVLEGQQVPYLLETGGYTFPLEAEFSDTPSDSSVRGRTSLWEVKLPHPELPVRSLTADADGRLFRRDFIVFEETEDRRGRTVRKHLGQSTWGRTPDRPDSLLRIDLQGRPATDRLYLETRDGDNAPLRLTEVRLHVSAASLYFKAESEAGVELHYGREDAAAPRYDLTMVGAQIVAARHEAASLGEPPPVPAKSALTRLLHGGVGWLFWTALVAVVAGLLWVILRLLPAEKSGTNG